MSAASQAAMSGVLESQNVRPIGEAESSSEGRIPATLWCPMTPSQEAEQRCGSPNRCAEPFPHGRGPDRLQIV
jgi:hypothetical protein